MASTEHSGVGSRWRIFLTAWLLFSALSAAWSVSTPIGAAPDEPAHLIKAASVARGEFIGESSNSPDGQKVSVPAYIAYTPAQTCYARNEQVTANCSAPMAGDPGKIVSSATTAGLYNPVYYVLVGWPSLLFHDDTGVYAMRIASGVLASLFLALTVMMLSTWRRRTIPMLGFAVAVTPMLFFMNGVLNPNSLETTATFAAFTGVLSIVTQKNDSVMVERIIFVVVSAALAVNARSISPLWVAFALLVPFVLARWDDIRDLARRRAVRVAVVVIVLAAVAAVVWIVFSTAAGAAPVVQSAPVQQESGIGSSPLRGFEQILIGTFDYGQGMIGVFGWLDTTAPPVVFFIWSAFIGGLLAVAIIALRGRARAFSITLLLALLLIPPIVQALYINSGGIVWQGRYGLPLFVCTMLGLAAVISERFPAFPTDVARRSAVVILVAWGVAEAYSAAFALKRYSVGAFGVGSPWSKVITAPLWSPPGGAVLSLALIAITVTAVALMMGRLSCSIAPESD